MLKTLITTTLIFLALAGCTGNAQEPDLANHPTLEDHGPAPELNNETWLNTDQPLRLANLRGKVVLLEMWTFG